MPTTNTTSPSNICQITNDDSKPKQQFAKQSVADLPELKEDRKFEIGGANSLPFPPHKELIID